MEDSKPPYVFFLAKEEVKSKRRTIEYLRHLTGHNITLERMIFDDEVQGIEIEKIF